MENNNYQQQQYYQQPQYYTTPGFQASDPVYLAKANELLKSAIIACVLAGFPVCSIIAIFKGMNLLEGATTLERNGQIGGHRK